MSNSNRLILGCGYLGSRVATRWRDSGHSVFALTRSTNNAVKFQSQGLVPLVGDVSQPSSLDNIFPECDTVLVSIGMDRTRYKNIRDVYVDGLQGVLDRLPDQLGHLIYISSTGVYGNFEGGWVTEESIAAPTREGGKACLEAEQLLTASRFADRTTILRLAGIYGPGRVPSLEKIRQRAFAEVNPSGFLNLIQVDDAAAVVESVAEQRPFGETFLVSDGNPVPRKVFYQYLAESIHGEKVDWLESEYLPPAAGRTANSKRICSDKLNERLDLQFQFPDFKRGLAHALAGESNAS